MSDKLPITEMQEAMLVESQSLASANVSQWVWHLPIPVAFDALQKAINQLCSLHPVLSSCFEEREGKIFQSFDRLSTVSVSREVLTFAENLDVTLEHFLVQDRNKGFLLSSPLLFRCHLIELPQASCCVFTVHLSVIDNDSFALLIDELIRLIQKKSPRAHGLLSFQDFLIWNQNDGKVVNHGHWCKLLKDSPESVLPKLPLKTSEVISPTHHGQVSLKVENDLFEQIILYSSVNAVSIEVIMQAVWVLLLHRYCNMNDVVFGASGQFRKLSHSDFTGVLGSFINTLPVRIVLNENMSVLSLLSALDEQRNYRLSAPHTPLLEVLRHGNSNGSLFSTDINFEYASWEDILDSHGEPWSKSDLSDIYQSSFDLACNVRLGKTLNIKIDFNVDHFDVMASRQLIKHFKNILIEVLASTEKRVFDIVLLDASDLDGLNQNRAIAEEEQLCRPVHEVVYQQALVRADAIAVMDEGRQLTYSELVQQSDILAYQLSLKGVGLESIVAIVLPRSIEFVITALAILRAGAAYLPLSPSEPSLRLESIVSEAKVGIVVTNKLVQFQSFPKGVETLFIDDHCGSSSSVKDGKIYPQCNASHAAYVIFTSGTTGTPKGVLIEHGSLSNHCLAMSEALGINENEVSLQFASTVFDVHVEELFTALCAGACLVIREEEVTHNARDFFNAVIKFNVTILNIPTAFWTTLVEAVSHGNLIWPKSIKTLIVGGESVSSVTFSEYRKQNTKNIKFLNGYGPTETTITSTFYAVPDKFMSREEETEKLSRATLPIGKPISGVTHYILDKHKRLSPPGVFGELYIGGKGVARGYLNNTALTEQSFISLAHIAGAEGRFYGTGDQVFSDGEDLFFVGRSDHQVKVRGFRIELGEIEAALKSCDSVSNAIVEVDPNRSGVLVAFIESRQKPAQLFSVLQSDLSDRLPTYMLPSDFECFELFPLTPAGKVDRKALWKQYEARRLNTQESKAPLTERQVRLMALWKNLLGEISIDITDSFFELGGHSLLAVKLFSFVEKEFKFLVPVREFFQDPTIVHLDGLIEAGQQSVDLSRVEQDFTIGNLHSLQADGSGCPIYCICGVDLYQDLADELGNSQPVYGIFLPVEERMLQSFSEGKGDFALPSTQEMAADYVKVIRQNQPFGPYKLAGISFGGILAYEIAQQLVADGEVVETLVLIDSFVPRRRKIFSVQKFQYSWHHIKLNGIIYLRGILRQVRELYRSRQDKKNLVRKINALDDSDFDLYRHVVYRQSALNYAPDMSPYEGSVILIHAIDGEGEVEGVNSPDHGWGEYVQGGVSCVNVPGDHVGVLKQPNVKVLADQIRSIMQKTSYHLVLLEKERGA